MATKSTDMGFINYNKNIPSDTVGSIDDYISIEDGTTARLRVGTKRAFALQRNLERERVRGNNSSAYDFVLGMSWYFPLAKTEAGRRGRTIRDGIAAIEGIIYIRQCFTPIGYVGVSTTSATIHLFF